MGTSTPSQLQTNQEQVLEQQDLKLQQLVEALPMEVY